MPLCVSVIEDVGGAQHAAQHGHNMGKRSSNWKLKCRRSGGRASPLVVLIHRLAMSNPADESRDRRARNSGTGME